MTEQKNETRLPPKQTDINQLLSDLHGGLFEKKLAHVMTQAALATIDPLGGGASKVTITFDLKRISQGRECKLEHTISYKIPTENGEKTEKNTTNSVVYVNAGGNVTIIPETQQGLDFGSN